MTNNEMEKACKNCHWFKPNEDYSHAITCLDSFSKVKDTDTCENFVTTEDYEPTGIWAEVAELVETVAKEVEKREMSWAEVAELVETVAKEVEKREMRR